MGNMKITFWKKGDLAWDDFSQSFGHIDAYIGMDSFEKLYYRSARQDPLTHTSFSVPMSDWLLRDPKIALNHIYHKISLA